MMSGTLSVVWTTCIFINSFSITDCYRKRKTVNIKNAPPAHKYDRFDACLGGNFQVKTLPDRFILDNVTCNQRCKSELWKREPIFSFTNGTDDLYYTLVLLDPHPNFLVSEFYLHWLLVNIKGNDMKTGVIRKRNILARYKPPTISMHKFQFLVFLQENQVMYEPVLERNRRKFKFFRWLRTKPEAYFVGPLAGLQFRLDYEGSSEIDASEFSRETDEQTTEEESEDDEGEKVEIDSDGSTESSGS